ncbi:unnamed protein product [Danaus chrysippus]|uniref:(African queen) hypothetical protein n=1 Tax=Danaus chrysippus TaxID=151541 RepID=A0A8J2QV32_9NEOP|nr:unnamed protein product [Danaus chrysippus]
MAELQALQSAGSDSSVPQSSPNAEEAPKPSKGINPRLKRTAPCILVEGGVVRMAPSRFFCSSTIHPCEKKKDKGPRGRDIALRVIPANVPGPASGHMRRQNHLLERVARLY